MKELSRRGFIAAGCVGCVAVTVGCANGAAQSGPTRVGMGELRVGETLVLVDRQIVVTRGESSITAVEAQCTHQGCAVSLVDDVLKCPCHGSKFDRSTGAVLRGPATEPLPALPVSVDGENIWIG